MSGILDTNVVIRYLANDPDGSAAAAARVVEDEPGLLLPPVVLAEVAYVLMSRYHVGRAAVVDQLTGLVLRGNVNTGELDKPEVLRALEYCRPSGRVSIVDALVWATARMTGEPVYTFDRRFPRDGIDLREP